MNVSRFRGAALAWVASLASTAAFAQYPYPSSPSQYPAVPTSSHFYSAAHGQPPTYSQLPSYYPPAASQPGAGMTRIPPASQSWRGPGHFANPNYTGYEPPAAYSPATYPPAAYPAPVFHPSAYHQGTQSIVTEGNGPATSPNDGPLSVNPGQVQSGELPYPAPGRGIAPGPQHGMAAPGNLGGGFGYGSNVPYGGNMPYGNMPYAAPGVGPHGAGYFGGGMSPGGGPGGACGAGGASVTPWDMYGGYGDGMSCYAPRPPVWYAGAYGMMLSSDRRSQFTFSFDDANEASQYTDSRDAHMDWNGGFAVVVGRYFNCNQCAVEATYWGWFPDDVTVTTLGTTVAGNLDGIFNWDSLDYNGATADTWVNNAEIHALFRSTEVQNIELNVLHFGLGGGCSPAQFSLLGGVRYFRFSDQLIFGSDTTDTVFDGDDSEIFYSINTENELVGVQIGGVGTYCVSPRFVLNGGTKFGLYENMISHTSVIFGSDGIATINNGPFNGRAWAVNNQKEDVSFLGELFLGGSYCAGSRWSVSAGYRAVAVTGLALPTSQIYAADIRGINDVETIESNDSAVLHGWYVGGQFSF